MFGYVRPYKPDLLIKDFELYKSVYCGLCQRLGRDYGFLSRLILSYDCTFLAVILSALSDCEVRPRVAVGRCTCNPVKKCFFCSFSDGALEKAAAFSVISFYYKLSDSVEDDGFFKSLAARFFRLIFKKRKKKATTYFPEYDKIVSSMMERQVIAESTENCSVDMAADASAKMISELMQTIASEEESSIYSDFGYFLGRWIYIIDAADDLEKDSKSNSFNPIKNKFKEKKSFSLDDREIQNYCNGLLNQCCTHMVKDYEKMNIKRFKPITDNVIYNGLPQMQRKVIFDRKNNHNNDKFEV